MGDSDAIKTLEQQDLLRKYLARPSDLDKSCLAQFANMHITSGDENDPEENDPDENDPDENDPDENNPGENN